MRRIINVSSMGAVMIRSIDFEQVSRGYLHYCSSNFGRFIVDERWKLGYLHSNVGELRQKCILQS
jgi:hypothetical protein